MLNVKDVIVRSYNRGHFLGVEQALFWAEIYKNDPDKLMDTLRSLRKRSKESIINYESKKHETI